MGFFVMWKRLKTRGVIFFSLPLVVSCFTNNNKVPTVEDVTSIPTDSGSASNLVLNAVVKSNSDSTALELIGSNDQISSFCVSSQSGSAIGQSSCKCSYQYENAGGSTVIENVETDYVEGNMIRCSMSSLANEHIAEVKIRIYVETIDLSSNAITVNFNSVNNALDLTSKNSYLEVKRTQCRDYIYIPNMFCDFDECLYDPLQSESTRFSYPINFYGTNLGLAPLAMVERSVNNVEFYSKWDCAFDPNNPRDFENKNIYSVGPDNSGSKLIFPPTGGLFDRSTFYLAKERAGVFSVAINTLIAPGVLTSSPDFMGTQPEGTFAPIGWGARPIVTPSGEVCPETAQIIPPGYRWVKVWAFKGDLPPRRYVATNQQVLESGHIACNPSEFNDGAAVFSDCGVDPLNNIANSNGLAARIFLSSLSCVNFEDQASTVNDNAGTANNIFAGEYVAGTDIFTKTRTSDFATPWNLEDIASGDGLWDTENEQGVAWSNTLFDGDLDQSQSRRDFLFVVSPAEIMYTTMVNKLPGYEPYYPYTFKRSEDCSAIDPDSNATCQANADKKTFFDLWSAEITDDAQAPSQGNTYPICALQPI